MSGKWLAQDSAKARIQTLRFVFQRTRHQTTAFSTSEGTQVFFSCFTKNIETLGIAFGSTKFFFKRQKSASLPIESGFGRKEISRESDDERVC